MNLGRQNSKAVFDSEDAEISLQSRYFGIATHYCLEMMNNFDLKSLDYSLALTYSRYASYLDEKDFIEIKSRITNLIKNSEFINLVKDSKLHTEQSLIYKGELKILDLLIEKDGKYYIFDYKTTNSENNEHIKQISFYKEAIKNIFTTNEVYSYLIYLQENRVYLKSV